MTIYHNALNTDFSYARETIKPVQVTPKYKVNVNKPDALANLERQLAVALKGKDNEDRIKILQLDIEWEHQKRKIGV